MDTRIVVVLVVVVVVAIVVVVVGAIHIRLSNRITPLHNP